MSKLLSVSHQGRADNEIQAPMKFLHLLPQAPILYQKIVPDIWGVQCLLVKSYHSVTPPRPLLIALLGFCGKKDVERLQYASSAFIYHQKIQHQCGKCPIRTQGLMHLSPPGMNLHSFYFYLLSHGALRTLSQAALSFMKCYQPVARAYTVSLNTTYLDPVTSFKRNPGKTLVHLNKGMSQILSGKFNYRVLVIDLLCRKKQTSCIFSCNSS